jgi:hypothetical protein
MNLKPTTKIIMKKQMTLLGFSILMISAVLFSAFTQQQKSKNNGKEQHQDQSKNKDKPGKAEKAKAGNNDKEQLTGKMKQKDNQEKKGMNDNNGKKDMNDNNGKNEANSNKGKKADMPDRNDGKYDMKHGYKWNRETFKNRDKIKNGDKVTLCHKFKSASEPGVTITVSRNALKAHMNHGDVVGNCPAGAKGNFSDIFLRKRTDYYNIIENRQEQVSYSRSVLDYALIRLSDSRLQLATLKNNNMPVAEIERKQATVAELEQNVSLLETLIGVAINIVVNKLQ